MTSSGTLIVPVVGEWYARADRPQPFQVVAVDEDAETIDVEYFDGTVDEWPFSHWQELGIEHTGAAPDPSGALGDGADEGAAET